MRKVFPALSVLIAVALAIGVAGSGSAAAVADPIGDTFGTGPVQLDTSNINAEFGATSLTVTVQFSTSIQPPSAGAANSVRSFIFLDTDQDPSTGSGISGLGADFQVVLAAEPGQVDVLQLNESTGLLELLGQAPVSFTSFSFSITIPLALIGDDGLLDYFVLVGVPQSPGSVYVTLTDQAPNQGFATSAALGGAAPPPAPPPTPSPTPSPSVLPSVGGQPPTGSSALRWVSIAFGALLVASGGLVLVSKRRTGVH